MTKEPNANLGIFFEQAENWILKDIRLILNLEDQNGNQIFPDRSSQNFHRPFVAAVILICCAIDCLAAFRYGRQKSSGVGKAFKDFIRGYFNSNITKSKKSYYDKDEKIYEGLRNALVHGYSLENLVLGHTDKKVHLQIRGDRIIIDVFSLYFDLESVYNKYKKELLGGEYLDEFNKRWDNAPLIQCVEE